MSSSNADEVDGYEPTYRQREVDDTLDDHEIRINRLEKGALIAFGYLVAEAPDLVGTISGFFI